MAQKKEMGEAWEETEMRDKALDNLAKWISDFRAVVKVVWRIIQTTGETGDLGKNYSMKSKREKGKTETRTEVNQT